MVVVHRVCPPSLSADSESLSTHFRLSADICTPRQTAAIEALDKQLEDAGMGPIECMDKLASARDAMDADCGQS